MKDQFSPSFVPNKSAIQRKFVIIVILTPKEETVLSNLKYTQLPLLGADCST